MLICLSDITYRSVEAGTLLIDSSTIDQATVRAMAERATEKGASYIDAPVSGGSSHKIILVIRHNLVMPQRVEHGHNNVSTVAHHDYSGGPLISHVPTYCI